MRKPTFSALLILTLIFAAFTIGFFCGSNQDRHDISVSVSESSITVPVSQPHVSEAYHETESKIVFPISINHATKEEFMALPGIGDVLAERIVDYRTKNGNFSSPEELLNVEGIGKKRLEEILHFITIGGIV